MIRPNANVDYPYRNLCRSELDGIEELEKLIAESEKNLLPCPCCGRKNPKIVYGYEGMLGDIERKHTFAIRCPGDAMYTSASNPNANGCGLLSGVLWATEDENLADFKEAIRYITEAWNRRS